MAGRQAVTSMAATLVECFFAEMVTVVGSTDEKAEEIVPKRVSSANVASDILIRNELDWIILKVSDVFHKALTSDKYNSFHL